MRPSNNLENKTPWDNENQTPFMGDGLLKTFLSILGVTEILCSFRSS